MRGRKVVVTLWRGKVVGVEERGRTPSRVFSRVRPRAELRTGQQAFPLCCFILLTEFYRFYIYSLLDYQIFLWYILCMVTFWISLKYLSNLGYQTRKLIKALLFKQTLFYYTMKRKSFSLYNICKKFH